MRLGVWQKSAVYLTTTAVALSGAIWFAIHDLIVDEPSEFSRTLLIVHGVVSYALLVILGSMLPLHVRSGWRNRHNLWTGLSVLAMMAILSISALVLYYGGEDTREPAKWVHLGFGIACAVLFPAHFIRRKSSIHAAGLSRK